MRYVVRLYRPVDKEQFTKEYRNCENNPDYWQNICAMNERQTEKGMKKYGEPLEGNTTLSRTQRVEHLQEEMIDGLKYAEHLKQTFTDSITGNDYQRMAMRTHNSKIQGYDKIRNAAYGLNGESGEVIDLLKKHEFQGHELDKVKLAEELGDVLWYCALMADAIGAPLEEIMRQNVKKLESRYPEGFSKDRSVNRD